MRSGASNRMDGHLSNLSQSRTRVNLQLVRRIPNRNSENPLRWILLESQSKVVNNF